MADTCVHLKENKENNNVFYEKAEKYWEAVEATNNGVLGGFGWVNSVDAAGSCHFLDKIFKSKNIPGKSRALDCGAGIGRVTKEVLFRYFSKVDLVEQNEAFLKQANENLSADSKVGRLFHSGLQNFEPSEKYDVIWCQWVLGHLKDDDLVSFLQRCTKALNDNGIFIIKENISSHGTVEDSLDSSVTRPIDEFLRIFKLANLRVTRQAAQNNFPKQLFSVKLFALRPISQSSLKKASTADNNSAKGFETKAANESDSATESPAAPVESESTDQKP